MVYWGVIEDIVRGRGEGFIEDIGEGTGCTGCVIEDIVRWR